MRIKHTLFLAILFLGFRLLAQNNIRLNGTITDSNNQSLAGVLVQIDNQKQPVLSSFSGQFNASFSKPGKHIIKFSQLGYQTYIDTFDINADKLVMIVLQPHVVPINEVVVRENYENNRNKVEVMTLEVIKKDFLVENNAGNLIKTIEKLPGVYSMDVGSGFSKPVIRGMGFNRVAVVENGIKQEGQQWGADHGLEIDQFNVDKMEVYKGPMSLQYGSDAIGGVLNIISLQPYMQNKVFADIAIIGKSNNNMYGISAMTGVKHNNWYVKARFTEQHWGDYSVPTDTIVYLSFKLPVYNKKLKNTAGFERDIALNLGYTNKNVSNNIMFNNVYQSNGYYPGSHGIPDKSRLLPDGNERNIEMPNSSVNHFKIINNTSINLRNSKLLFDIAFQDNRRQEQSFFHTHYGNQAPPTLNPNLELDFKLNTYSFNAKWLSGEMDKWQHSIGINTDLQQNRIAGYNFLLPQYNRVTAGIFVLEKFKIAENILINGGARFDMGYIDIKGFNDPVLKQYLSNKHIYTPSEVNFYQRRSYTVKRNLNDVSYALGLVYNANKLHTIKINIGKSFRLPGANELASNGVHHGTFRHEQGDTALLSEKGYQLDLAYTYDADHFYFSVNPFFSWFSNYIYLNPTGKWSVLPHAGQIYKYTQAQAMVTGGEVTASYEFIRNFTVETGFEYTYLQNLTDGYPLPFSPPMGLLSALIWHIHNDNNSLEELHVKFEHRYLATQNRIARNEEVTPGANLFDFSTNTTWVIGKTKLLLSIQLQNIFNTRYFNHLSFYRKLNIPEPGRNIQVTIRMPFN